uniref:VWFD domain-containing protein n=1 Tax=Erpetoichthys calabaricus TaxID=27687 RepID=A0A8C4XFH8_ERPCA
WWYPVLLFSFVCLVFVLSLNSSFTIAVSPAHNGRVCSTWGNYHFKTFDGDVFQLLTQCNYIFASHCKSIYEDFNIQVRRSVVDGIPVISKITMKLDGTVVQFSKSGVLINGQEETLPYSSSGVFVEKSNSYIKVTAKLGLMAMWNEEDALLLEIEEKYANQTCGLCGDFNGVQIYDEFIKNDVQINSDDFGSFWKMDDPMETCVDSSPQTEQQCPDQVSLPFFLLIQTVCLPALNSCRDLVPMDAFIDSCNMDLCYCNKSTSSFCLCSTISEYSRQCVHAGGEPQVWRSEQFCYKDCPFNMKYQECGNPCADTCTNPSRSSTCEQHCVDGCFCPPGTVLDDVNGKGCISVQDCSCTYSGKTYMPGESFSGNCQTFNCSGGKWVSEKQDCPGTCSLEGGSHITSFDGRLFTFHGDCSYVLAKVSIIHDFSPMSLECLVEDRRFCKQILDFYNPYEFNIQGYVLGVTIFKPSTFYLIIQTSFGLQLKIQLIPIMQVYIKLDQSYKQQTCGLCGNFNNKQEDDFTTMSGVEEGTASTFSNTWKTMAGCPQVQNFYDNPCSLSVENERYAKYWCSFLTNSVGPFAECHSVIDPAPYKNCMYDICNYEKSEESMCAAISSYVQACAAIGIELIDWRTTICTKYSTNCPRTMVYGYKMTSCGHTCRSLSDQDITCNVPFEPVDGCGCAEGTFMDEDGKCVSADSCPCYYKGTVVPAQEVISDEGTTCGAPSDSFGTECQKSCQTLDMNCYSTECISGCVCPEGLVSDGNGDCIPEDQCPCVHNGKSYQPGEKIKVDCNTCTCKERKWKCTNNQCLGTCAIYGDGHYITFDKRRFSFNGDCEYTLTQDYCNSSPDNGTFRVVTENIPCGTTGTTCSKAIKLFLGNNELKLSEGHVEVIQRNTGTEVPYKIRIMGIYLVIEANNGMILMWDRKTSMFIKLSPKFKGDVCGLCGNYDGDANNDFTTRSLSVVVDALEFGNSWKVSPSCPDAKYAKDPCLSNPYRQSWAQKQCSIIKSVVFTDCHHQVDPIPYYDACVQDSCACDSGGDCECFCTAVASYAKACNEAEVCVAWRSPEICPLFCDYYNPPGDCEWHYKPCGAHCMKTCRNPSGMCSEHIKGLEGCYPECPPEEPFFDEDSMKCVPSEDCGCFDDEGHHYQNGDLVPSNNNSQQYPNTPLNGIVTPTLQTQTTPTEIFTSTEIPTPLSSSPPTSCKRKCEWSRWYDNSYPLFGPSGGDYETYNKIIAAGGNICKNPNQIECRAEKNPDIPITEVGQIVTCDISQGLICKNTDQEGDFPLCYNYQIRVLCCDHFNCETTSSPLSTSKHVMTTSAKIYTTTAITPTSQSPGTMPITTAVTKEVTTKTMLQSETTTTSVNIPTTSVSTKSTATSTAITPKPTSANETPTKKTTIPETTRIITSEVTISTEQPTSSTATTETTGTPISTEITSVSTEGTFTSTTSTQKPTTPKETTLIETTIITSESTIASSHFTSGTTMEQTTPHTTESTTIRVITTEKTTELKTTIPLTTTSTEGPLTSTIITEGFTSVSHSTEIKSATTAETPETTTKTTLYPVITTTLVTEQTTSLSTEGISTSWSIAPLPTTSPVTGCVPCDWSEWFDVNYPNPGPTGDYETFENIRKEGYNICDEPEDIECRAVDFPDLPLEELRQTLECNRSVGLICNNEDQGIPPICFNYKIRVKCCTSKCNTNPTSTISTQSFPTTQLITSKEIPPVTTHYLSTTEQSSSTPVTRPKETVETTKMYIVTTETTTIPKTTTELKTIAPTITTSAETLHSSTSRVDTTTTLKSQTTEKKSPTTTATLETTTKATLQPEITTAVTEQTTSVSTELTSTTSTQSQQLQRKLQLPKLQS